MRPQSNFLVKQPLTNERISTAWAASCTNGEAGGRPFNGTTAEEVRLKHLFERPAPLSRFLRKTAFGAEDAILACLEKDPGRRLADYDSLDRALAEAAKRRGVRYQKYEPSLRYEMPMVGAESMANK